MKIISWNVNGIRAVIKKGFLDFLKKEKPDVLCLQEIKIAESARKKELAEILLPKKIGYEIFWNSAQRPGYSGTVILVKTSPPTPLPPIRRAGLLNERGVNGFSIKKFDIEGRVQTLDLEKFYLVNAYFPNANHELSRLDYKLEFNKNLLKYLKKLKKSKPVIICGDFNVAHQEIDLARPKDNVGNPGFTYEERDWMTNFLKSGFIDTFRHFHPRKQEYSWWSYRFSARAKNIGWRIDYFCCSDKIIKQTKSSFIMNKIMGSDHCPVGIEIKV
ncbi:exodeoxyribonuclease III [Candidatus Falkowbacteria bacterium CG11_big_fil_rev_8_21_14_0_20_39_10]|uniref:Exodeoxyribonuclease III n=1 Tax=Candidatus Falkowbacteria bacterium CG11_big_fil_rev_8_21_14_0_20_39_10 TaxID=1974570 RepID=A0A2M6KA23_9BACT|nr:MAG: exodeoxyribonuclease III [Candidatus Falkowbacteria bacterium CG11_big_fil_rev_8_21_14_0_20_39_10]